MPKPSIGTLATAQRAVASLDISPSLVPPSAGRRARSGLLTSDSRLGHAPTVVSVNISAGGIPKSPVPSVYITQMGLVGEGHNHEKHRSPGRRCVFRIGSRSRSLKKKGSL